MDHYYLRVPFLIFEVWDVALFRNISHVSKVSVKRRQKQRLWGLFWRPFHRALTRGPRRFKLVLYSCAKAFYNFESLLTGCFLTFFPPLSSLTSDLFWLLDL